MTTNGPADDAPAEVPRRGAVAGRRAADSVGSDAGADPKGPVPVPQSRPEPEAARGRWAELGSDERDAVFTAERARLVGLAYRITGSRLDAEDIVQEAWLRAQRTDWSTIDRPQAWLTTVVSRLALDHLRSARHRRETYVGPWLPEPVRSEGPHPKPAIAVDPADVVELSESLTFGFLRLLETLSPIERVVFLLAEVFDTPYRQIASVVDRSPDACRQIASRARRHVHEGRVRHDPSHEAADVVRDLVVAVSSGDVDRAISLLASDVVLISDGGADSHAARRPVHGSARVARFMMNLARRYAPVADVEPTTINGEPGLVASVDGEPLLAMAAEVVDGVVCSIYAIRSPQKLAALSVTTPIR